MSAETVEELIEKKLQKLSSDKLAVVLDFVSYLLERQIETEALGTTLASEAALRQDWEKEEEEEAWANL